jgi:hypothetical protein
MSAIYTRAASKKAMAGKLGELFRQNAFGTESPRAGVKGAGKNARRQSKTDT